MSRRLVAAGSLVGVLAASLVVAPAASAAGLDRSWVASTGSDTATCTRDEPCRTWAGALAQTRVGGVVTALDDASYGPVTITDAVTLDGADRVAATDASGGPGIVVDAPPGAQVVLRGLDLKGVGSTEGTCGGTDGILLRGAASLHVQGLTIAGFDTAVHATLEHSSVDVYVDLSLVGVEVTDSCRFGVHLDPAVGHAGRLTVDRTSITGSNVALRVEPGGEAWVSGSTFYLDNQGVQAAGPVHDLCGNAIAGNADDGGFTDQPVACVPAAIPPSPPPPPVAAPVTTTSAYCAVPRLRGRSRAEAAGLLAAAGCRLGPTSRVATGRARRGEVVHQRVPPGLRVAPGTAVGVTLGRSRR